MFKALERWWNARTPVWLHNGTKENLLFQLIAGTLFIVGFIAHDKWRERRWLKQYNETHGE